MAEIWLSDLILKESGLMSTLQLRGNSNKLVGFCQASPKFNIKHEYSKKDKTKSILNLIKLAKEKYAGTEITMNMLKSLSSQLGKDNIVSRWFDATADKGMNFINDLIGKSSNYENYRNLSNTVQYWLDTTTDISIPTFTALFLPDPINQKTTTEQAKKYMNMFGGISSAVSPGEISKFGKDVTSALSKSGVDLKAGWYKYSSPNGYGPASINRTSPKNIEGTFILTTKDNYEYKDLLIDSINVSMSDSLIKSNGVIYPTWIKFDITFLRAVEYTVTDVRETFKLI